MLCEMCEMQSWAAIGIVVFCQAEDDIRGGALVTGVQTCALPIFYGLEPGLDFADQAVALKALGGAQVVAFSQFACSSTRAVADVILPIGALPEIDATLTNQIGRAHV